MFTGLGDGHDSVRLCASCGDDVVRLHVPFLERAIDGCVPGAEPSRGGVSRVVVEVGREGDEGVSEEACAAGDGVCGTGVEGEELDGVGKVGGQI